MTKPLSPRERYMLYTRGFADGAGVRAMKHGEYADYERGYADGMEARGKAVDAFSKEVGYEPQILRACQ